MAIDYTGYCAEPLDIARRRIEAARREHPEWFDHAVCLYDPHPPGPFTVELAREVGIEARCSFLLSVNDKQRLDMMDAAIDHLYAVFPAGTLRIARDGKVFGPGLMAQREARERGV